MSSGQSWKDGKRVRALLREGEQANVVLPVRYPGLGLPWRAVRGCFLVLTGQRLLVFGYNRLLDIPTRLLWAADRNEHSVGLRSGRFLTVTGRGSSLQLVAPPGRGATRVRVPQAAVTAALPELNGAPVPTAARATSARRD
ncbi:hypothetical protein [Streptomyces armeniacus]|nr:hypothetical protein [Streptomyces armeniacus]